jgi:gentisate 1,2-dioxygenase
MNHPTQTLRPPDDPRRHYYGRIEHLKLFPLWEQLRNLVPQHPATPCLPQIWRFKEIRPLLLESAGLISAAEALRRVLILENPGLKGQSSITQALYAGLQLIMPGEIAPAHRHSQSALRFIVEGRGAYTAVDGERTFMEPGDFVTTPAWTWHDHGNELRTGAEPVIWLDGLDVPLVRFLDAGFSEDAESERHALGRPEGVSFARYGHNMAPVRSLHRSQASPVFNYPYARTREALHSLSRSEAPSDWDGWKLRYVNPLTGGAPLPTIGTFMQLLPARFSGKRYRGTDGTVFSVVEGSGVAVVDGQEMSFEPKDVFVVPAWKTLRLHALTECVLFSYSDRPVQEALGLHREELLPD